MRFGRLATAAALSSLLASGCGGGGDGSTGKAGGSAPGTSGVNARSTTAGVGQASLNLQGGSGRLAQVASWQWDLSKSGVLGNGTVDWTVSASRSQGSAQLLAGGYVRVYNGGSAPATIGNVVVNLQRKNGSKYATVCSDIANATAGDAATTAHVVAGASSEGRTSFSESAASGSLQLMDAGNNTAWALVPQISIPVGQSVDLLYLARFDNGQLGIPQGEAVRTELIVTFGNAGARGNGGASATNVDINGNGVLDADETNVRSVPDRQTNAVPATQEANATVVLTDDADRVAATGTVTLSGFTTTIGSGTGVETLAGSGSWPVSVAYDAGLQGGTASNTATLQGQDVLFTVPGPLDPLTLLPAFAYDFLAAAAVDESASSTVVIPAPDVEEPPTGLQPGDFRTQTQGGWGSNPNGGNPGGFRDANFAAAFPTGLEIGIPGAAGFSARFTSGPAVNAYLPAGGKSGALTKDLVNPTTTSAGVFGGQVTALSLSVGFSDAGLTPAGLGDLVLGGTGTVFDGMTVRAVLAAAHTALGGGGLPAGANLTQLNNMVDNLNQSFVDGDSVSSWAAQHLSR